MWQFCGFSDAGYIFKLIISKVIIIVLSFMYKMNESCSLSNEIFFSFGATIVWEILRILNRPKMILNNLKRKEKLLFYSFGLESVWVRIEIFCFWF